MRIRTRLLLGYLYLFGLLLAAVTWGAISHGSLGSGIEVLLRENYVSVEACRTMLDALGTQDRLALLSLHGSARPEEIARVEAEFARALAVARANVTESGEGAALSQLEQDYRTYVAARRRVAASRPLQPLGAWEQHVAPLFAAAQADAVALLEINQAAMHQKGREARREAKVGAAWLGVLVVIALVSLLFTMQRLQTGMVRRIADVQAAVDAIADGDSLRRLPVVERDEIGQVAERVNAALDAREAALGDAGARVAQLRSLLHAALATLPGAGAVLALDGRLVAACHEPAARWLELARAVLQARHTAGEDAGPPASLGLALPEGEAGTLQPLMAPPGRHVGWLLVLGGANAPGPGAGGAGAQG